MVEFAHPAALWLLTLILPIILLYLLKQKRREIEVPSILLWKQAIEDLRAHTPFQKLRTNLLLVLQILVIVLLTAILAQPYLPKGIEKAARWIVVLDTSASMKATDEKPDRFTVARDQLANMLDSLSPSTEVMLISLSSRASIVESFSKNFEADRRQLRTLKPQDTETNWQELALLLEPLFKEKPRPRIVIASDFSNLPSDFSSKLPFDALPVGKTAENVGITRAVLQNLPEDPSQQMLFYQIKNFGQTSREVEVEISANNDLLDAYRITLPAEKAAERTMEVRIGRPMELHLVIKPQDVFRLDNDYTLIAQPAEKTKVKVEIDDPFLTKALRVLPSIQVDTNAPIVISAHPGSRPGIYFQRVAPTDPAGEVIQWNSSHPSLRFIDPALWRLSHCTALKLPGNAIVLLEAQKGPVGYAIEERNARKLVFGFSLEDSNIYLLAGFPVFLQNSIEWISSGLQTTLPTVTGGQYVQEGPLEKEANHGYVNFASPEESSIAPVRPAASSSQSQITSLLLRQDVSYWFLILLVAVIIVEWWAFHQRIHAEV